MKIDFYISVIDNYGDMGFGVNLAISLLFFFPDLEINFYSDDEILFLNMTKNLNISKIKYLDISKIKYFKPSKIIFNLFDRKIDKNYLNSFDFDIKVYNFGYFLMHKGIENLHNTNYKIGNIKIIHLIPSLLENTAGIIVNPYINKKLSKIDILPNLEKSLYEKKWISVFCYKETFFEISNIFKNENYLFLVFDNNDFKSKNIINMPFLNIIDYYKILQVCDKNIVRGENSFCQSIISEKPFLWDIYKEKNNAHFDKINDFTNFLDDFNFSLEYKKMLFGFNNSENIIEDFLKKDFGDSFIKLGKFVKQNCDLLNILFKEFLK